MKQSSTNVSLSDRQVEQLRKAWEAQRSRSGGYEEFITAVLAAAKAVDVSLRGRHNPDKWNDFINWLDANHPNWRGIQSPKVVGDGVKPIKRFPKRKQQQSKGRAA